jgi:hopanoid biosynthesis associated radical SAM protein HpnH
MTVGMGAYIAKNKISPRPEWQKTVTESDDSTNPFKIIMHARTGDSPEFVHPMINKRFPLVLMLEPLHACNLTCTGCGRIREYESTITQRLTVEQCLTAVDECGAPTVSICGGEPTLYPEIGRLVTEILARGKNIILCTNGMFIRKKIGQFKPATKFFFNVHLDGMEKNHDISVEREGVFKEAIEGIKVAKAHGFKVCTNTTVYRETDMKEIEELYAYLETLEVDGFLISPAYGYSAVNQREIFMTREDVMEKFKDIDRLAKRFRINNTPTYLDFLKGDR